MKLPNLIQKAAQQAGSEYALAKALGITPQLMSDYKHARRACPVDLQAVMADIAGEDVPQALFDAIADRLTSTRKERFAQALQSRKW